MIPTHILSFIRHFQKELIPSIVSFFILVLGVTAALVALLVLYYHLGFEHQFSDSNHIYKVELNYKDARANNNSQDRFSKATIEKITLSTPELKSASLALRIPKVVQINNITLKSPVLYATDHRFWTLFDLQFVEGDPALALSAPKTAVISHSLAIRAFGKQSPLGQMLEVGTDLATIVGVVEDISQQSHLTRQANGRFPGIFITRDIWGKQIDSSMSELQKKMLKQTRENDHAYLYLKIPPNYSIISLQAIYNEVYPKIEQYQNTQAKSVIIPIRGIHLKGSDQGRVYLEFHSWKFIYLMLSVAGVVLMVSCLNYSTIVTAMTLNRVKELAVCKILGARGSQIMARLFGEILISVFLAMAVAFGLLWLLLPLLNTITDANLLAVNFITAHFWLGLIGLIALICLLSLWYPSTQIQRASPMAVIQQKLSTVSGNWFLKSCSFFQFSCSIVLLTISTVLAWQIMYLAKIDLGANLDDSYKFGYGDSLQDSMSYSEISARFFEQMSHHPAVISRSATISSSNSLFAHTVRTPDGEKLLKTKDIQESSASFNLLEHYQMTLLAGRNFSDHLQTLDISSPHFLRDYMRNHQIIKEGLLTLRGMQTLGISHPEDALGLQFVNKPGRIVNIVGVVNAFPKLTNNSMLSISPDFFYFGAPNKSQLQVASQNLSEVKDYAQNLIKKEGLTPSKLTITDSVNWKLQQLIKTVKEPLIYIAPFTIAAILVSLLGVYAMSLFSARRRLKEIGLRKILGSSTTRLVALMLKDNCKPLLLAFLVALPLAYNYSNELLQEFEQQIPIWQVTFVAVPLMMLTVCLLVGFSQSLRAAKNDPITVLRNE